MAKLLIVSLLAAVVTAVAFARSNTHPESHHAIALASIAYNVNEEDMTRVASCETGGTFNPRAVGPNTRYGKAKGLFQFLRSTWLGTPFASFSRFDPQANALAAAWLVRQDGGWREWTCKP